MTHSGTGAPGTDTRIAWLRLWRSRRVGPQTFRRLLAEHGDAAAALDALPGIAAAAGVEDYAPCSPDAALREYEAGLRAGARLLLQREAGYPPALADIADAPPLLWALGDTRLAARPAVALVGARNASSLGMRMAARLAAELGDAGVVVISGLARGVDAAAHKAALGRGTVAVMAGGVDVIYPEENRALAGAIGRDGLRLSEQPVGLQPQARHFPQRNRLVSGLAQAVVVVEAAARSGSLITARSALDQGREVMAVPGHPFDARASGCNMLIRDGATLVRAGADVLEALARLAGPGPAVQPPLPLADAAASPVPPRAASPDALAVRILSCLGASPVPEDQLIRDTGHSAAEVTRRLVALEMDGEVLRQPGGMISRPA